MQSASYLAPLTDGKLSPELAKLNREKLCYAAPYSLNVNSPFPANSLENTYTPVVVTKVAQEHLCKARNCQITSQVFGLAACVLGCAFVVNTIAMGPFIFRQPHLFFAPRTRPAIALYFGVGCASVYFWQQSNESIKPVDKAISAAFEDLQKTYKASAATTQEEAKLFNRIAISSTLCKAGIPSDKADELVLSLSPQTHL